MQDQTKSKVRTGDYQGDYSCKRLLSRKTVRGTFYCSISVLAVFCLSFILAPYIAVEAKANAAQQVSASATWEPVSLELDPDVEATTAGGSVSDTGHGDILFGDIHPTSVADGNVGTEVVIKKTIGVTTTGKFYTVYLSTASSSNALAHTFSSTGSTIPAIVNSTDSSTGELIPTAFSDAAWGYTLSSTIPSGNLGQELTKVNNSSIYNTDTWLAVPVLGSAVQIKSNSTTENTGFSSGDTFPIYYGIMIDTDVLAGTYENEIVYTALASSDALDEVSKNLTRDKHLVAASDTETLSFDLSASTGALIDYDDVKIYLVPHSMVVAGKDTNGNYTVTSAMETARDNAELSECSFTAGDFSLTNTGTIIICTLPDKTPEGTGDGVGSFDFWVNIPTYNYNYISKYTSPSSLETGNTTASIVYAGLQSTYETTNPEDSTSTVNLPYVAKMQEMTSSICKNTNMWGSLTGAEAQIYDYRGEQKSTTTQTVISSETGEETEETVTTYGGNPLLAVGTDAMGVSTFELGDVRDNNTYKVRRFADGDCWMAESLRLDLSTAGTLTPEDTDLTTDWTPDVTTVTEAFSGTGTYARFAVKDGIYYYNWYAAVAETVGAVKKTAAESICPHGWHVAYLTRTEELLNNFLLSETSPETRYTGLPFSAVAGGTYYASDRFRFVSQNYETFWYNASYNDGTAYKTNIYTTMNHHVYNNAQKGSAVRIRCVAR